MAEKIISEAYVDLIMDIASAGQYADADAMTPLDEQYVIVHIPENDMGKNALGIYPYEMFPTLFTGITDTISQAKGEGMRPQDFGLSGQGVLVAVIDTGIAYAHPAFLGQDGTPRIVSIWDQTLEQGPCPEGFSYGTEYCKEDFTRALQDVQPLQLVPSADEVGHGTLLAAVAAGNADAATGCSGVAPAAELVVVKLKPAKKKLCTLFCVPEAAHVCQETDVLLAMEYVRRVALRKGMPLVICLAMESTQGNRPDNGVMGAYLNRLAQSERIGVVLTAGTAGNKQRHTMRKMTQVEKSTEIAWYVGEKDSTFAMEIWECTQNRVCLELISPAGEPIGPIYPRAGRCMSFQCLFSPTMLWVNSSVQPHTGGKQLFLLRFQNAQVGAWRCKLYNVDSRSCVLHTWLPSGTWLTEKTYFLEPNATHTITYPGSADAPLTVAAYHLQTNQVLAECGIGAWGDAACKPDLAAPGEGFLYPLWHKKVCSIGGVGTAAAYAAGMMALVFEWAVERKHYPHITGVDAKHLLMRGAKQEGAVVPNPVWGYGKMDFHGFLQNLR